MLVSNIFLDSGDPLLGWVYHIKHKNAREYLSD